MSENPQRGAGESADVYRDYPENTTERKPRSGSGSAPEAKDRAVKPDTDSETIAGIDPDEFALAWDAAPAAKRSPKVRGTAAERWAAARERLSVDDAAISRWYRRYVDERRQAGVDERYIAALSTWLAPKKPIDGPCSLEVLAAQDAARRRERERNRAEAEKAEHERDAYEQEKRRVAEWLERDPRARELRERAFAKKAGPSWRERAAEAFEKYLAYKAECLGDADPATGSSP